MIRIYKNFGNFNKKNNRILKEESKFTVMRLSACCCLSHSLTIIKFKEEIYH